MNLLEAAKKKDRWRHSKHGRARPIKAEYIDIAIGYINGEISIGQIRQVFEDEPTFANKDLSDTGTMYLLTRTLRWAIDKGMVNKLTRVE